MEKDDSQEVLNDISGDILKDKSEEALNDNSQDIYEDDIYTGPYSTDSWMFFTDPDNDNNSTCLLCGSLLNTGINGNSTLKVCFPHAAIF